MRLSIHTHIYIYVDTRKNHKDIFFLSVRGLDFFLLVSVFFPNTAIFGCKPATYRSIMSVVFLKSWICRTASDSMSVTSRDSIPGSMLTFAYCFFQHDVGKNTTQYFLGTSKFGGKFGSICGQIWVPYRDSQFASLPSQSKTKIHQNTQLNKKKVCYG